MIGICSSSSVWAYSYDEIVLLVQAEEKVFGKADYASSLDQRLESLENQVLGHAQSGSDSYRLRAICKRLGLHKEFAPVIASPYSVVLKKSRRDAPPARSSKSENHFDKVGKTKLKAAHKAFSLPQQQPAISLPPVGTEKDQTPAEELPANPACAVMDAEQEKEQSQPNESNKILEPDSKTQGATFLGSIIVAAVLGLLGICLGLLVFLFLRAKSDSRTAHEFGPDTDLDSFENSSESDEDYSIEESSGLLHLESEVIPEKNIFLHDAGSLYITAEPEAPSFETASFDQPLFETVLPASPELEWEKAMSLPHFFEPEQVSKSSFLPLPGESLLEHSAAASFEYEQFLPASAPEQISFSSNFEIALDADPFDYSGLENWTEIAIEDCPQSLDAGSTDWLSFDVPVAPKIISVNTWVERHAEAEVQTHSSVEEEPMNQVLLSEEENAICADDSDCASYRALAQLLIEAARQVRNAAPESKSPRIPVAIPMHGKKAFAVRSTPGRLAAGEYEDRLRSLFAE
ncbi:MAG: hypothetical protein K2X27_12640 [Candidatus Obscuribacterales bacterium]|nr:hypothetical protein [Candidatus Obscuribacterales bacterium]